MSRTWTAGGSGDIRQRDALHAGIAGAGQDIGFAKGTRLISELGEQPMQSAFRYRGWRLAQLNCGLKPR